jgi:hypothetical protein
MPNLPQTNFAFQEKHDPTLMRLGMQGERYFPDDPNTSLLKMHQYAGLPAHLVETRPIKPLRIRQLRGSDNGAASQPVLVLS